MAWNEGVPASSAAAWAHQSQSQSHSQCRVARGSIGVGHSNVTKRGCWAAALRIGLVRFGWDRLLRAFIAFLDVGRCRGPHEHNPSGALRLCVCVVMETAMAARQRDSPTAT